MGELSKALWNAEFYGILDTGYVARNQMREKCGQLIASGAKIIQLRAKRETHEQMREIANEILPLFNCDNAPFFIINDDVELAAALPNAGLHIGQDDLSPKEARLAIGEGKVLGLSTHSIEQARNANGIADIIDYFAVGPVFPTMTKPGRATVGLELVSEVSKMRPCLPWFTIGGINLSTARQARLAGAERIVAVSDVLKPDDTVAAVAQLLKNFHS